MNNIGFPNGGICQHRKCDEANEFVLVFSSFSDGDTVLAAPLSLSPPDVGIPFLVGNQLMFIAYCGMFRAKTNDLQSVIGHMDYNAIDMIVQGISSALRGDALNIPVPTAVLFSAENEESKSIVAENKDLSKTPPKTGHKYTRDDYLYIVDNYKNNMDGIIAKYGIKDKRDLYRIKYALCKRFGEEPGSNASEPVTTHEDSTDGKTEWG